MIPHTGVQVYGIEYFYGGGVQAMPPADVEKTFGLKPVDLVPLGTTDIPQDMFLEFLRGISPRFTASTYK